jgi:DNA modification methylase
VTWELHHGDARHVSDLLEPASVDLIVTSPPYFALRSYRDGGEHYDGQIGSEASPSAFLDALIECTADWLKVLRPGGSMFVNLGDKRAGSGGHNNSGISTHGTGKSTLQRNRRHTTIADSPDLAKRQALAEELRSENNRERAVREVDARYGYTMEFSSSPDAHAAEYDERERELDTSHNRATRRNAPDRYNQSSDGIPTKSLMLLPHRYAIRCTDELGLIVRADIVWHKPNGLPESVTDRVRQSHEYWFHLTREARYFAAVDEIREAHAPKSLTHRGGGQSWGNGDNPDNNWGDPKPREVNPLGALPGSVWTVPSEPLTVPAELGVDHFAAFPSEWPRRLILGWSPSGWCQACGEPRRQTYELTGESTYARLMREGGRVGGDGRAPPGGGGNTRDAGGRRATYEPTPREFLGYSCACPNTDAPTRPAVVLDPFAGTGTTVAVAHHLDRHGIGIDLSRDYLRLAEWRCTHDTRLRDKVLDRAGLPAAPTINGQLDLFNEAAS